MIIPVGCLVIILTFSKFLPFAHERTVCNTSHPLFVFAVIFPLLIARNCGDGKQTHQHLALWTFELPSLPHPLPHPFPFILLPAAHPSCSFWGPLAAVPIIHPKTQHPHQALANLCSTAKTQQENERGKGMARGQNAFSASLRASDQEQGRRAHLNEWERQTKRERCWWWSGGMIKPAMVMKAAGKHTKIWLRWGETERDRVKGCLFVWRSVCVYRDLCVCLYLCPSSVTSVMHSTFSAVIQAGSHSTHRKDYPSPHLVLLIFALFSIPSDYTSPNR